VETSERKKSLTAAHQEASRRLRLNHEYEFHSLLEDIYFERGINVQKRLTGSRKRDAELDRARALLNSHEEL
jgi:hypothetical protein